MICMNAQKVARMLTTTLSALLAMGLRASMGAPGLAQSGTFANTGSLDTARGQHGATLLQNGKVLVSGGSNTSGALTSAELYRPSSRKWTFTGSMHTARVSHTATLLQNGQVLAAGGGDELTSTELYDPSTGTWSMTGSMNDGRRYHTATLLNNGKVLVAGGEGAVAGGITTLSSTELYDPSTGTWTITGSMTTPRAFHTATLLEKGEVLVAAGNEDGSGATQVASAELYNPTTGMWTATGSMHRARGNHPATLLRNGQVLVVGGRTTDDYGDTFVTGTAELYDPANGQWTVTGGMFKNTRELTNHRWWQKYSTKFKALPEVIYV